LSLETEKVYKQRFLITCLKWFFYFCISIFFHALVAMILLLLQNTKMVENGPNITWIAMPSPGVNGSSGGSVQIGNNKDGERQRRVDTVAIKNIGRVSNKNISKLSKIVSSVHKTVRYTKTSVNKNISISTHRGNAETMRVAPNNMVGTAGVGAGGGVGVGTSALGLRPSNGANGTIGLISELDSNFPFVWYLQQIQFRITDNWGRVGLVQGRVQVYFRIMRSGVVDGVRIESPSSSASFDRAAFLAVLRSSPLPKLPDGFDGDSLGVKFWFTYLGT
jgi:TonB family protein